MRELVIVGGSFGGLTTAYELRRHLTPAQARIRLVSKDPRFTFIPSLPWVTIGSRTLDQISFDLAEPLARQEIEFTHATVESIATDERKVRTDAGDLDYDIVVLATGHRSANEAVPGLGPFDGPGHSLMSPAEAVEAGEALQRLLLNPGPVVIGCAAGASCIGPAYEFAFELDHLLRKRSLRTQVPITFVTPEPYLGHFGIGGIGKARQFLEGELEERDIRYKTSTAVARITEEAVELADGRSLPSAYSMIIPPLAGVKAVATSPGVSNSKGFVPTDDLYRHPNHPDLYAVGVAVAMAPVEDTPVPVNFPKTGHMTEQMARIAAGAIAASLGAGAAVPRHLTVECILDMGTTAVHFKADPVRPPRNKIPKMSDGPHWLLAKKAFERYYLYRAQKGSTGLPTFGW